MPDKKPSDFTVTDRRRFTSEGEAAPESPQPKDAHTETPPSTPAKPEAPAPAPAQPIPPAPSAAEQKAQQHAFNESKRMLDDQLRAADLGGRRPQQFEMNFERFIASLYMTALMQLGLVREEGGSPPPVDLLGARQTIDTIGILGEKTKGNLTPAEDNLIQNCLYELRMAYVEVTNALAQPPPPGAPGKVK